jgi:hypothetical protein
MASKKSITVGLKCDSTDYDKKLAAAKKKTKSFGQESVEMFKGIAAAVAGSKAAMEVFNRVVASSQTIGDAYARTMSVAKTVTDDFVYSIANADFTRFTDGLKGVRQRAQEAYDALDQLGNTQISYKYFSASERATFREGIITAKDTTLSMDERRAGLAAAEAALGRIESMTETLSANTTDYLRKEIGKLADLNASEVEMDALAKALAVDVSANAAQIRQGIIEKNKEYERRYAAEVQPFVTSIGGNERGITFNLGNKDKAAAAAASLNAEFGEIKVLYTLLNRVSDEVLQKLSEQAMSVDQSKYAMGELVTQLREAERALNKPIQPGTVGAALTGEQYAQSFGVNYYNTLGNTLAGKASQGYIPIQSVPIISDDIIEESLPQVAAQAARVAEESYSAAEGIYAISDALGNLSGIMDDQTAKWYDWGVAMLGAIGQFAGALSTGNAGLAFSSGTSLLGGLVSMPGIGGELKLRIQGSDLVGSISNYNKIKGRSYGG